MRSLLLSTALLASCALAVSACGPANPGVPGSTAVAKLPLTGTIFTIVFENHNADAVLTRDNPYINGLADRYGSAAAYLANEHPSLPNYLLMTSGSTQGVGDDDPPAKHPIPGDDNLADQLDAAGVRWRAYMEGMGKPCTLENRGRYAVRHDPFVYYTSLSSDAARCRDHVVDMDANFSRDLAAGTYQFMWITPDVCNDMHDCSTQTADAWLARVIPQIQKSPGYRAGGAIFLLWDEGSADFSYVKSYVFRIAQNIPFVLVSEKLVSSGFVSNTTYGHDSYLATVEDALGIPRLPATVGSTPMADFFIPAATTPYESEGASDGGPPADTAESPDGGPGWTR